MVFGIPYSGDIDINIIPVTATGKGIFRFDFGEVYAGIKGGLYFVGLHVDENVFNTSKSDNDNVWGMQLLAGVAFDLTNTILVGVEGKYILTQGVDITREFNLNGYTVSALFGFRF